MVFVVLTPKTSSGVPGAVVANPKVAPAGDIDLLTLGCRCDEAHAGPGHSYAKRRHRPLNLFYFERRWLCRDLVLTHNI